MKNYSVVAVLLALAGLFVFADNGKKYGQNDIVVSKVVTQTTTMYHHDDVYSLTRGDDVAGSFAKITRTEAGVGIQFSTSELPAGAYTVWLLVYNNPEECADGDCDLPDIDPGTPAVNPAAIRISQDYISNANGAMSITAWVPAGDPVGINHDLIDIQLHDIQGGCREHQDLGDMTPPPITLPNGFELCPDPQGATFKNPFAK